jgi:hypothetical protein
VNSSGMGGAYESRCLKSHTIFASLDSNYFTLHRVKKRVEME